jgi:putative DNA primase/helicase
MPRTKPLRFAPLMEPTASALLGEPNASLSKPPRNMRFGTHGSMSVDLEKGAFYDHENNVGGGVLDLIQHKVGCDRPGAMLWLTERGWLNESAGARPRPTRANVTAGPPSRIVAKYPYTDEAGTVLFQSVRYEPKKFSQRRPDGQGGWEWGLDSKDESGRIIHQTRRVLYRLPELIAAVAAGKTAFVTEGEKDADNLRDLGFVATTNPMGAKKWEPAYSEFLRGADVVIIGDHDAAGRDHVKLVSENLIGIARRVRVLDLVEHWPECPDGGDISKWLESGGDSKQLNAWIESTPEAKKLNSGPELASKRASEYKMRSITWFWRHRFALGKVGLIAGLPDRGKGLLCADMAARATKGDEWPCGEGHAPQGNVLILSAEDDCEDTIIPRLAAAGADMGRVHILEMVRTGDDKERMFSLVDDLALLRRKIEEIGDVVFVIIDPMSAYLGVGKVDSYRTTDVRSVLAPLVKLAAEKRVFVLGVLHFNKQADVTNALLRISDSLAFVATARHCYAVVDDAENKRRLLVKAKNNLAPDTKALAYSVSTLCVGQDDETGESIHAPRIEWWPKHVEVSTTEAMAAESGKLRTAPAREVAEEFLHKMLGDGPVAKTDIMEAAEANCISEATLRRAKDDLGVIAEKDGLKGGWRWRLPETQKRYEP